MSNIGDKYSFFSWPLILTSVTSVSHNSFGLLALNRLLTRLFATLPICPLYDEYFLDLVLNLEHSKDSSLIILKTLLWLILNPLSFNTIVTLLYPYLPFDASTMVFISSLSSLSLSIGCSNFFFHS